MPKTCANGCNQPVWSKKLCRSCWGREYGKPIRQSKAPVTKKVVKRVKPQTTEEAIIKAALSKLKKEIELEAVQNNEYYCAGCGKSYVGLDKSHILAVGYIKDLELCKENIQLMCRLCHAIWESMDIALMVKLNCFDSNLAFIKEHDTLMYNKLQRKSDEYRHRYFQ